jgi:hypothetical protein
MRISFGWYMYQERSQCVVMHVTMEVISSHFEGVMTLELRIFYIKILSSQRLMLKGIEMKFTQSKITMCTYVIHALQ